ncbi:hypothetical protein EPD60_08345 [Flaviaesturariibacter flavus]|uniref:Uncharacterized protein n=1 Tax=Flaviaesturariibacter flavus TaxID=2502780 RepID=A0A4R1BAM2_9BACT|nr:hypothetical protein [Flaviaesturariibacter flavus]TCJ14015.1 hypothetical protein EPD60_08345 [Flaviaesturariibacter flavus]
MNPIKPLNKRQECQFNMVQTTVSVFNEYARVVTTIAALRRHAARLGQLKESIAEMAGLRIGGGGAAGTKEGYRKQVEEALGEVSGLLLSLANEGGDNSLKALVSFAPSYLQSVRDGELPILARRILVEARGREAVLTSDWGMDAQTLTDLEANIGRFDESSPAPQRAIQHRAASTVTLKDLFSQVNILLHESLDPLMRGLRKKHPELFAAYTAARVIRDNPTRPAATPAAGTTGAA